MPSTRMDLRDQYSDTALILAADAGHVEVVRLLLLYPPLGIICCVFCLYKAQEDIKQIICFICLFI